MLYPSTVTSNNIGLESSTSSSRTCSLLLPLLFPASPPPLEVAAHVDRAIEEVAEEAGVGFTAARATTAWRCSNARPPPRAGPHHGRVLAAGGAGPVADVGAFESAAPRHRPNFFAPRTPPSPARRSLAAAWTSITPTWPVPSLPTSFPDRRWVRGWGEPAAKQGWGAQAVG